MKNLLVPSVVATSLLVLIGCSRKEAQVAPPPPEVVVATVVPRDVPVTREGVATLDGFMNANINAQVQGYLISRDYKEGSFVKKGDLLFQIDPRPFEATLAQAKGNLDNAHATQIKADADEKRAIQLFNEKVTSPQERDASLQAAAGQRALVAALQAAVRQAEINVSYTKITAPIDGVVGIANVNVGDLVGPSTGTLAAISQVDPIKATVNLGENSFTDLLTRYPDAEERQRHLAQLQFDLSLGNGKLYPYKGKFYAQDRNIDPKTGAIKMELTFPNPGNVLRPGQFGKVHAVVEMSKGAPVIPQDCVTELQGTQMVGVVGNDHTVTMRPVKMGERDGAFWQVLDGVKLGETVVVQGLMKVRPGMPVTVKDWTPPAAEVAVASDPKAKED